MRRDELFQSTELTERLKRALLNSPLGYRLARRPYQLSRYLMRVPHDPDYRAFRFLAPPNSPFLDVGANSGTSAMSYSLFNSGPIFSVEANPNMRSDLVFAARVLRGQMRFMIGGAGSRPDSLDFHVPYANGVAISAEGSFDREKVESSESLAWRVGETGTIELRRQRVEVTPIDSLDLAPAVVKIDVEGHELEVLRGMRDTLARSRPILLIEAPEEAVTSLLGDGGYEPHAYDPDRDRLIRGANGPINTFFLTDSHSRSII